MLAVELREVYFTYAGGSAPALKGIDLEIEEGEFVVVTGPSGCGKSTLCRLLNGLIPHFYEGDLRGEVRVFGMSTREVPTHELARYVGMVFQDPENQLFLSSVEREIAFGLENLGLPPEEIREKVEEMLDFMDLREIRDKAPFELSGGQQQKVAIASVLAMEPKMLVLDEPTANLDPYSSRELLELVARLNEEKGMTVVLVEHRLDLVLRHATRLVVMDEGTILLDGAPREVVLDPRAKIVGVPKVVEVYEGLERKGIKLNKVPLTPSELARAVESAVVARGRARDRG